MSCVGRIRVPLIVRGGQTFGGKTASHPNQKLVCVVPATFPLQQKLQGLLMVRWSLFIEPFLRPDPVPTRLHFILSHSADESEERP